jgi:hypothetical protein
VSSLAVLFGKLGNMPRAIPLDEEALRLRNEVGDVLGAAVSLMNLGGLAHEAGRLSSTSSYYVAALEGFSEAHDSAGIGMALVGLAEVAADSGMAAAATQLAAGADRRLRDARDLDSQEFRARIQVLLPKLQDRLGPAAYSAGWDVGHALPDNELLQLAQARGTRKDQAIGATTPEPES